MTTAETRPAENREWIDFAKGVAILLVVLYHSSLFLDEFELAGSTPRIRSFLSFFPMPVFFFVAGLTARRMLTWSFPDLWRRRLLTLVYLYVLWSVIRVLFYLVVPHLRGTETAPTDPANILLLPIWPTSSYWFIWALAVFTLLAWLIRGVPPAVQIAAAALLAVSATTPGLLDTDNVGWDRVAQNFVFFLLAVFLPHATYRLAARVRVWHAIALAGVYAALALGIVYLQASRVPGLIFFASVVAVALGIATSTLLVRVKWLSFVSLIGRSSLHIYLLHLFIVALALALIAPFADYQPLQRVSNLLPFLLAAVAIVASLYLLRPLRRFPWLWVSPFRTRRRKSRSDMGPGIVTSGSGGPRRRKTP